ncbi:MAG: phosphate-starvation-inducible PsiE family protein [Cyanobacteria bacterium P01_A01_bin.135]
MGWIRRLRNNFSDDIFLRRLGKLETIISKALSVAMVIVLVVSVVDLFIVLWGVLRTSPEDLFNRRLFSVFGIFLDVLIALEILENITAYLKRHVVQVELVIVTSLTAVARKIIILDLDKATGVELIGLAIAIFALSTSYWIVRRTNSNPTRG